MLQCADLILASLTTASEANNNSASDFSHEDLEEQLKISLEAVQTIIACAIHQKRIVDDVLTLSKLDAKLLVISLAKVQPMSVVQTALRMFSAEFQKADIQAECIADDSLHSLRLDCALLDSSRLLQILINLVTNAIKFTRDREEKRMTITIGASVHRPSEWMHSTDFVPVRSIPADLFVTAEDGQDLYLWITVEDTGCGLTPEEKGRLFTRFTQASPKTHGVYGGSGLGLFISRELVEMQCGEIGVRSEPNVGSTFVFFVKTRSIASRTPSPAKQLETGVPRRHSSPVKLDLTGFSILLTEDNLINQKVLGKQLEKLGCVVHVAGNGVEALDFIRVSSCWRGQETSGKALSLILMDV